MKVKEFINKLRNEWFLHFLFGLCLTVLLALLSVNMWEVKYHHPIPKCMNIVSDFYKDEAARGSTLALPITSELGTVFGVFRNDGKLTSLCVFFPWTDISRTACAQMGDSNNICTHLNGVNSHYGYGTIEIPKHTNTIKPQGPSI